MAALASTIRRCSSSSTIALRDWLNALANSAGHPLRSGVRASA